MLKLNNILFGIESFVEGGFVKRVEKIDVTRSKDSYRLQLGVVNQNWAHTIITREDAWEKSILNIKHFIPG